nr:hypothetical protein [Caulobacter hibisci]
MIGSAIAVGLLVGLSAWARLARPTPPLDVDGALALLAEEFPDHRVDSVWLAGDGAGLVARSASEALVLWRRGDGYVARSAPWADIVANGANEGRIRLPGIDGAPRLVLGHQPWPPAETAA